MLEHFLPTAVLFVSEGLGSLSVWLGATPTVPKKDPPKEIIEGSCVCY